MRELIDSATSARYTATNGSEHQLKVALPPEGLLRSRLKRGVYCYEGVDLMKRCSKCKEYWPADTEFFYQQKKSDGLYDWCKACYQEWRYPNGRKLEKETADA